jgi:hypothetical protein
MNRAHPSAPSNHVGPASLATVRAAACAIDRERIFQFRYQVYVEEMRRLQKYADHSRRRIEEPFDASGHLLIAECAGGVVGTLRTNFSSRTDLGYYVELFGLASLGAAWPEHVSLTTKLMVAPSHRCGRLAIRLAREMYAYGEAGGVQFDIIDCNAHLRDFFSRLGYKAYMGTAIHPEYGEVLPMRLDIRDIAYLRSIRSPLAPPRVGSGWDSPAGSVPDSISMPQNSKRSMHTTTQDTNDPTPGPTPGKPGSLLEWLDSRIADVLREVEATEFWKAVTSPEADPRLAREAMKEVYLEIFSYQAHAIEGAINAIARMPRSMPVRMIKAMLRHQAEEFDHGEMALRDHVRLGGDEAHARLRHRISPAAYATASIWRTIGLLDEPFAYLGALYPFEGLTPIVSARVKAALLQRGFPVEALEFVEFHSTEDPKHTELIRHLIEETAQRYPEAEQSIRDGLERFLAIYPIPVWETAYRRALRNLSLAAAA